MANPAHEFTEPRFHSLARAPHDSRPIIEVKHAKRPCGFILEFAAGANDAERVVMRMHDVGKREIGETIRKGELLFSRIAIPTGDHEVTIRVEWKGVS